ncbi:uncharacterized protein LOC143328067 [Chaetodon auriga]|uniref:uncharacterized protein LOC143328067 n=1 Tax=Chaetodon auriga TaxID=39042 RepID=UPI004032E5CD
MDKIINFIGEKAGDVVEDAVKSALGFGDKDEDKKEGGFSLFGGDKKKEEEEEGGLFSFGRDKKKEEEKGGFFSNMFDKDDEKEKDKKSGFHGLFSEQGAAGGNQMESEGGESGGQSVGVSDGDLLSDLMDVAEETSKGQ